ncbi:DUF3019 domain-containing protein [Litorilituus sediminis]|uniref:DUF3019 domain-containing protein n=1 Tax=Litorilituus sediminis TaxID=718192 RepID=A0A4P6PBM4_9GAMM|nr:DUF3019 domain-containing protein [Litorilituus sediminis]QBG37037.1 DUF3019 domain-containing protein [Litorilituus sediminis]
MYSSAGKGFALLIPIFAYLSHSTVWANSQVQTDNMPLAAALAQVSKDKQAKLNDVSKVNFVAQPAQCVTLRQGRDCFASIQLTWQSENSQSICLYQQGKEQALKCWQGLTRAQYALEFESNESVIYQLRTPTNSQVIAETDITVSWLHKRTSRKRRWRLF